MLLSAAEAAAFEAMPQPLQKDAPDLYKKLIRAKAAKGQLET
ncbi:MAG: hypothetical protein WBF90_26995 [Rivularia sp. (in: cyanobacteria)]